MFTNVHLLAETTKRTHGSLGTLDPLTASAHDVPFMTEAASQPEPLRYAVIGLGRAGWNIHVDQLRGRPDARITAVADPVQDRRDEAAREFGCKTFASLSQLLNRAEDDIDVVIIATPSATHAADTKKCLRAGKHVVVEKPMATTLAEAD